MARPRKEVAKRTESCQKCQVQFLTNATRVKYCPACAKEVSNARSIAFNKAKQGDLRKTKTCKVCNKSISDVIVRRNFCSDTCMNKNKYARKKEKINYSLPIKPKKVCKICGDENIVSGHLLCKFHMHQRRSNDYYARERTQVKKETKSYEQYRNYPSNSKEYHLYTANASFNKRKKPCVYVLECCGLFYIGQTSSPIESRMRLHANDSVKCKSKIYEAMRAGAKYSYKVLEYVEKDELKLAENFYISSYKDIYGEKVVNQRLNRRSAYAFK